MPSVGKMRHLITFESRTIVVTLGEANKTWSTLQAESKDVSVWSEKTVKGGTERNKAEQLDNPIDYIFVIQYRTDITANMRIVEGSSYFSIKNVFDKVGDKKWLSILATENQDGASGTN